MALTVTLARVGIRVHCGPEQPKIQAEVLGHSLVRSLVRSHRSIVRLLPRSWKTELLMSQNDLNLGWCEIACRYDDPLVNAWPIVRWKNALQVTCHQIQVSHEGSFSYEATRKKKQHRSFFVFLYFL